MRIEPFALPRDIDVTSESKDALLDFYHLLNSLNHEHLPAKFIDRINALIEADTFDPLDTSEMILILRKKQKEILAILEKELNLVPVNYYAKKWLVLGIPFFGIPLGLFMVFVFQAGVNSLVGFPYGMVLGFLLGSILDQNAFKQGRQLKHELSYFAFK